MVTNNEPHERLRIEMPCLCINQNWRKSLQTQSIGQARSAQDTAGEAADLNWSPTSQSPRRDEQCRLLTFSFLPFHQICTHEHQPVGWLLHLSTHHFLVGMRRMAQILKSRLHSSSLKRSKPDYK